MKEARPEAKQEVKSAKEFFNSYQDVEIWTSLAIQEFAESYASQFNGAVEAVQGISVLLALLAEHGGTIVSTASLSPEWINQARASGRMYVDANSLGYVWEPDIKGFPETPEEVEAFEKWYPIDIPLPEHLKNPDFLFKKKEAVPSHAEAQSFFYCQNELDNDKMCQTQCTDCKREASKSPSPEPENKSNVEDKQEAEEYTQSLQDAAVKWATTYRSAGSEFIFATHAFKAGAQWKAASSLPVSPVEENPLGECIDVSKTTGLFAEFMNENLEVPTVTSTAGELPSTPVEVKRDVSDINVGNMDEGREESQSEKAFVWYRKKLNKLNEDNLLHRARLKECQSQLTEEKEMSKRLAEALERMMDDSLANFKVQPDWKKQITTLLNEYNNRLNK